MYKCVHVNRSCTDDIEQRSTFDLMDQRTKRRTVDEHKFLSVRVDFDCRPVIIAVRCVTRESSVRLGGART
jgi:hypothetical protein